MFPGGGGENTLKCSYEANSASENPSPFQSMQPACSYEHKRRQTDDNSDIDIGCTGTGEVGVGRSLSNNWSSPAFEDSPSRLCGEKGAPGTGILGRNYHFTTK